MSVCAVFDDNVPYLAELEYALVFRTACHEMEGSTVIITTITSHKAPFSRNRRIESGRASPTFDHWPRVDFHLLNVILASVFG